jgi:hypothetical protein
LNKETDNQKGDRAMWKTLDEQLPEAGKDYPIWVKSRHTGNEFSEYGQWFNETWFIWHGESSIENMGWDFIAWFDLLNYR